MTLNEQHQAALAELEKARQKCAQLGHVHIQK
jgi:hypothetical protein